MPGLGSAVFTLFTDSTQFERGLAAAGGAASAATAGIGSKLNQIGNRFTSAGRSLTRGLTVPMLAIGAMSVKLASQYQQDLVMIHTQAGASVAEMKRVNSEVMNMVKSGKTAFAPDELVKAMYHVESLQYRGAKAYHMLTVAQKAASIGNADLEQTTTALGATVLTGIKGLGGMSHAAGLMMGVVGQGNMRLQDYVDAMKSGVIPMAKDAGISFASFGTALAVVTDRTGSAQIAANRLRTLMTMIAAPTDKAKTELHKLGLTTHELAGDMMKPNGIMVATKDLAKHLAALPAKQRKFQLAMIAPMFGGSRSTGTMATLLTAIDSMQKKYPLITRSAANFNKNFDATKQTAIFKFHKALAQVEQSLIVIGEKLMPLVAKWAGDLAKKVGELVNWYNKLSPAGQHVANSIMEIMLFAGPVLMIFGTFIKVLSPFVSIISKVAMWIFRLARYLMVMLDFAAEGDTIFIGFGAAATAVSIPVLAIVAAVVALVAGLGILYVKNRAFHHAVVTAWNAIKHAVEAAIRFIEKDWRGLLVVLLGPFGVVIDLIVAYWSQIESAAGAVVTFITGHWRTFVNALLTIFAPIAKAIIDHFGNIKTFGSAAWGVIKTAVGWVVSEIQSLISWLGKIHWPSAPGWLTNNFITKHLAAGTTNWGGGVAMVGERGPELVNLPRGSQVYTAQQTSAMMAGGVAGVMGGGGVSTLSGVLKIINWEEGLVMIDTVAQTAIDHNNAYRRR